MTVRHRQGRRPAFIGAVACLSLAFPLLGAGSAQAAPAATRGSAGAVGRARPAAAPSSDVLSTLSDLLARLLPVSPAPSTTATATPSGPEARVIASTVRVRGVACGFQLTGSGFSPSANTIVTNAHVVAGVANPVVQRPDGVTLPAQVQIFDPDRDLAVLAVPGLGEPALPLGSGVTGESAAIFGHPRGQFPVAVTPARVARRVTADVGNIYDSGPALRRLLVLSARIQPGDSGAPLVNGSGQVIGVAFATSVRQPTTAFAIATEDLTPVLARPRSGQVSTGPCLTA